MINYGIPKTEQKYTIKRHQQLYEQEAQQIISEHSLDFIGLPVAEKPAYIEKLTADIPKPPVFTLRPLTVSDIDVIADQHAFANQQRQNGHVFFDKVRKEEFLKAVSKVEGFTVGNGDDIDCISGSDEKTLLQVYDLLAYPDRDELINVAQNSYILNRESEKNLMASFNGSSTQKDA